MFLWSRRSCFLSIYALTGAVRSGCLAATTSVPQTTLASTTVITMGLLDWLRSSDNPDAIETLLKGLAEQTSQLEGKQHRVAARRDSVTLIISLHGTLAYLVYLLLLYVDVLPDSSMLPPHWAVLVFWPLLILALRQLGLKFFNHRLRSLAHQLDTVRKRQHAEIEKLKKQTRYDETRALIERLESPRPQPQQQHQQPSQQKGKTPRKSMPAKFTSASATPQGSPIKPNVGNTPAMGTPVGQRGGLAGPEGAGGARPGQGETTMMSPPGSAARRGWADRFADVLLGENEGGGGGQYALICGKCFNHNGLVLKEELPYTRACAAILTVMRRCMR